MFTLEIQVENAAFQEGNGPSEIARLLKEVARKVEDGATYNNPIFDINSNRVGNFYYDKDEEEEESQ